MTISQRECAAGPSASAAPINGSGSARLRQAAKATSDPSTLTSFASVLTSK
ncbi:MAG TPA: hypothetical protein VJV79_17390 [Polyangiaceae bacterium]|nr:hypothetical protein [Polyangiaceae bacterium]